jgi:putative ABC transport system permease protein
MNTIFLLIKSAIDDLRRNKVRTLLTSLGILIGVLSVVLLIAFGLGLKNFIQGQFESLGANLVIVFPGQLIRNGQFRNSEGATEGSVRFDEKDINTISKLNGAQYVVPAFTQSVEVKGEGKKDFGDLYATNEFIFPVRNLKAQVGQIFDNGDITKRAKVAVMGPKIAEKIFNDPSLAVGKYISLNDQRFKVIGVIEKKGGGGLGGPDFDSYIYIPYSAAAAFNPKKEFLSIIIQAENDQVIKELRSEVTTNLLKRYKETDFTVTEQTEILNIVSQIFGILNTVLVAIGSISLIVGGIGIMNIMYASVTERIKEIGIRRAIGATKKDILLQFLTQAVILSLIGGSLGLVIASLLVILIHPFFPAVISPVAVVIALGISSLIGVFFGVFPARKAANLSPIEAIKYE